MLLLFILCGAGVACNQEDDPSEQRRDEQREQNPAKWVAVAVLGHAVSDMDADEIGKQQRKDDGNDCQNK